MKAAENQSGYIVNVEGNNLSIRKQHAEVFFVGTTSLVYEKNNKFADTNVTGGLYPKAVAEWERYESRCVNSSSSIHEINVDLSKFSVSKDHYFMVKTDWQEDSEAVLIEVPKSPSVKGAVLEQVDNGGWVKVKGSDGKVIGDESDPSVDSYSELLINGEWLGLKKESGSRYKWGSYFPYYIGNTGNKPADYYSYSGATLQVAPQREYIEGGQDITSISWPVSKTKTKNISLATDKSLTTPLTAIKTSTRDGIPAKLTVPKRPSAPAVVVDYLKGTIAIPKRSRYQFYTLDPNLGTCRAGMHFRNAEFVLYTEENTDTDSPRVVWVGEKGAAYDDKKENWLGKYDVNDKPFYVEHYQYITDKKKKFLSSKIRRTLFKGRKQTDNPDGNMLKTSDGIRTVKDITIRFACEKSGKYTIVFENASLTNQYYVRIVDQNVKKGTPPKVLDKTYKLLKAKKDSTVATLTQEVKTLIYKTNLTAKEDFEKAINQEEGKKIEIFITKIGNKKTEEWSGFASKVSFVEGGDGEFVFE